MLADTAPFSLLFSLPVKPKLRSTITPTVTPTAVLKARNEESGSNGIGKQHELRCLAFRQLFPSQTALRKVKTLLEREGKNRPLGEMIQLEISTLNSSENSRVRGRSRFRARPVKLAAALKRLGRAMTVKLQACDGNKGERGKWLSCMHILLALLACLPWQESNSSTTAQFRT